MKRVFKASGASPEEIQAMRDALDDAAIDFEERPPSMFGGGQAGLWVKDAETSGKARKVIEEAQRAWVQHARENPQSIQAPSIFGSNRSLIWMTCIIVILLNVILLRELFFGW